MDTINEFLKNQLPKNFGLSDNKAIENLNECFQELKEFNLISSVKKQVIPPNELPSQPFGHVDKITRERIINNQKKQSMDQIVEKFKTTSGHMASSLSLKSEDDSSDEFGKDDLNPSRLSDYDKESVLSVLTDSNHSSLNNEDNDQRFLSIRSSNNNNSTLRNPSPNLSYNNKCEMNHNGDVYAKKLDRELEGGISVNGSPRKNTTRIIYHAKDDVEYIRNSHGIYSKPGHRTTPVKKLNTTNQLDYV